MNNSINTPQSHKHLRRYNSGPVICLRVFNTVIIYSIFLSITGCEKNFDLQLGYIEPQLVVEAYINNEIPEYNYVMLSKSQTPGNTDITSLPIKNAVVKISSGSVAANNTIMWDANSTVVLKETHLPGVPSSIGDGIYTDPFLQTDPNRALRGQPGKYYLLEIEINGQKYTATTALLYPIPILLSTGFHYTGEDGVEKARLTVNFKDPDTTGNCQLFYWRHSDNRQSFGWGSLGTSKRLIHSDENNNGSYLHITDSYGFVKGDRVTCYMANVTRSVYNFWDSYNKARNSSGLLTTPVSLVSDIKGKNVTGCFSGLAISTATIVVD